MFFQVTPPRRAPKQCLNTFQLQDEDVYHYEKILGPFQGITYITLNTCINTNVQCFLTFKNVNKNTLKCTITKEPPDERCISFNTKEFTVQSNDTCTLEITWCPKKVGNWRDTLQVTDNRRIKYDMSLILNAHDTKRVITTKKMKRSVLSTSKYNVPPFDTNVVKTFNTAEVSMEKIKTQVKRSRSPSIPDPNKENINMNFEPTSTLEANKTKKIKKSEYIPHDFSAMINAEFCLSPFQPKVSEKFDCNESKNLITSERNKVLRRETYDVAPTYANLQNSGTKKFENSLSPIKDNIEGKSDFSILVNNINFTPKFMGKFSFSPEGCSTVQRTIRAQFEQTTETTIFEAISDQSTSSNINRTYELSPTSSKTAHLKQVNLENQFESLSPVMPVNREEQTKTVLHFSSPISSMSNKATFNSSLRQVDNSSVKDIIEADLWVKSEFSNAFGITRSQGPLEMIMEESSFIKSKVDDEPKVYKIEISPPSRAINQNKSFRKISPKQRYKVNKEKHSTYDTAAMKKKVQLNKSLKGGYNLRSSTSEVRIPKLSLSGLCKKIDHNNSNKQQLEKSVKLHNPNDMLKFCNPDPFAVTMTEDPFLTSSLYCDEKWLHQQQIELTKWLNALLTAPEHLTTDVDTTCVDVAKVWQSCRQKEEISFAETKETVSARYHTDMRLNTLRKAAGVMFRNSEVTKVLSHTTAAIEKGHFTIRDDRNLHKDIGLQKTVLELFLGYNPLWLRIGLETIYGETIPLSSNNDLVGLTRFLLSRFFSDPALVKAHTLPSSLKIMRPSFMPLINKFMLKKFFFLVYFLDYAKENKLIGYDPCLFHKRAVIKDSKNVLLAFARELLKGIGDVTKSLRNYGYTVSHKQTLLDEFDYAVIDISTDLRDGVRLCRVMELITNKGSLVSKCRVPAISRLQKVHNVDVALVALGAAGYELKGDIEAKNIADGHREKTLSLLWQIIYKFQKPRFEKSASVIQRWWRAKLCYVRVHNILKHRRELAAYTLQKYWRGHMTRRRYEQEKQIRSIAARKIQHFWLYWRQRLHDRKAQTAALRLQRWWKNTRAVKPFVESFINVRRATLVLQKHLRAILLMRQQKTEYVKLKESVLIIQLWWRTKIQAKQARKDFLLQRNAVVVLQIKWKATQLAKKKRMQYLQKVQATRIIQNWWRQTLVQKQDRNRFLLLRDAVHTIEKRWIARNKGCKQRQIFLTMRESIIVIQRSWRRYLITKDDVSHLKMCREACVMIQKNWRCILILRQYSLTRYSCIRIQRWWRAVIAGRYCRDSYLRIKNAAVVVQKRWRMLQARAYYLQQITAVLKIQKWYRNDIACRSVRNEFMKTKNTVRFVENWWTRVKVAKLQRMKYLKLRNAVLTIQQKWVATILMRVERRNFLQKKTAAMQIQRIWRMFTIKKEFEKKKKTVKIIQSWWRKQFTLIQKTRACIKIQNYWRRTLLARSERQLYLQKRVASIRIQSYWRMFIASREFFRKRYAIRIIQQYWTAILLGKIERRHFLRKKEAAIQIQRYWRTYCETKHVRLYYLAFKAAIIFVQRRFRARKSRELIARRYAKLKNTVLWIQRVYRAKLESRRRCKSIVNVENKRNLTEEEQRFEKAAIKIQAFWRGYKVRLAANEQVAQLRVRTEKAAKEALPSSTIAYKLQQSINFLQCTTTVGQLTMHLCTLDSITRISPDSCLAICNFFLVDTIYRILTQFNRSLPWKDACIGATNVLINLVKFQLTKHYVIKAEYAETLARLLFTTCEKHTELFLHVATLMWLLTHDSTYAIIEDSRIVWLFRSTSTSIEKMKHKRSASASTTLKANQNILPCCYPDWYLKRQPRLFLNSRHAINAILSNLNLSM